jgi:hypothetical protein
MQVRLVLLAHRRKQSSLAYTISEHMGNFSEQENVKYKYGRKSSNSHICSQDLPAKTAFSNSGLYNMPVIGHPVLLEVAGTCSDFDVQLQSALMCPSCCFPSRRASANSRASMPGNLWQFLSPEVECISWFTLHSHALDSFLSHLEAFFNRST